MVVGPQTQTYVSIPQYCPLSLYINLEGSSIAKLVIYFSWCNLWIFFQVPFIYQGHGSWHVCKTTLRLGSGPKKFGGPKHLFLHLPFALNIRPMFEAVSLTRRCRYSLSLRTCKDLMGKWCYLSDTAFIFHTLDLDFNIYNKTKSNYPLLTNRIALLFEVYLVLNPIVMPLSF